MMEDFFAGVADRWPAGQENYHWHVLPGPAAARECLSRQYRGLTQRPGLAPVRDEHMHITVQHLAPVAGISAGEIGQITRLVQERCAGIAPFAVTAGRAEAWNTGVVCPVRPGPALRRLWQVTTAVAAEVTAGKHETRPAVYYPHLTLAYAHGHVDHRPMRAWISDSTAAEIALPVTGLVLVAQQHDYREITFRVLGEVPLTGTES
jgi:2'-5' RNA ligase